MTKLHGRNNNIGFIRLVAALMVVYSHTAMWPYGYSVFQHIAWLDGTGYITYGLFGVFVFFFLSGFLVAKSWARDPDMTRFMKKRISRIYPAVLLSATLTLVVLGVILAPTMGVYFDMLATQWHMIILRFLWPVELEMVRQWVTNPGSIHISSLWTLPFEWMFYALVLCVGMAKGLTCITFKKKAIWLIAIVFLLAFFSWLLAYYNEYNLFIGVNILMIFIMGVFFYIFYDVIPWSKTIAFRFLVIFMLWQTTLIQWWFTAEIRIVVGLLMLNVILPYLVIYFAFSVAPKWMQNIERHGDYSYGIYLYHFPVMQGVIHLWGPQLSFAQFLMISLPIIFLLSAFSWHFVEKPCLIWGRKSDKVRENNVAKKL